MSWRDLFAWGRKSSPVTTLDLFRELYGGRNSNAGPTVTLASAFGISTAFACGRVIGHGMAQVPLKIMRLDEDGKTRLPAVDHPLYDVLTLRANPWQTAFEYLEMLSWHVEFAGQHYAFKNAPAGQVRELIPFTPGQVVVTRNNDLTLSYTVTSEVTGVKRDFPAEAIWHVRGPSWNSWMGMDVLVAAREVLGLAIAADQTVSALQKNSARPSGILSVDGKLDQKQYDDLRAWIDKEHASAANSGKPFIADRGAKWMQVTMNALDAQLNETRRQQVEEVCRFFGVMPIMVGYSDKAATYASAEQMFLAHAIHTLAPRWRRYQNSIDANLLSDADRRDGLYANFVEEGMIRGAAKDTKDVLLGYVNGGLMTPNEGRAKLDLNPDPDPASDELRIPVTAVQAPGDKPTEPPAA